MQDCGPGDIRARTAVRLLHTARWCCFPAALMCTRRLDRFALQKGDAAVAGGQQTVSQNESYRQAGGLYTVAGEGSGRLEVQGLRRESGVLGNGG